MWLQVAQVLSKYFRIITPDIIGFGCSDKPTNKEYNIGFFVDFLQAFLENLHIRRPILCGHSFGGLVVTEFAIRFADQVERLILTAPAGPKRSTTTVFWQYVRAALSPTYENIREAFINMAFNPNTVTHDTIIDFKKRMSFAYARLASVGID
jgi:pimeloyl-ACP methyl ester carboxylesterase